MSRAVSTLISTMRIVWAGPYGWPGYSPELPSLPQHPGVYLLTVDYDDGFLIYAAGLTRRPFANRFAEHTRSYLAGRYNVLDIASMRRGVRRRIFHGWDSSAQNRVLFGKRRNDMIRSVQRLLAGFRIFVADVGVARRILERVKAAIMNALYSCSPPFCNIPDRGTLRMPRWESEERILAINECSARLYGLPPKFEI